VSHWRQGLGFGKMASYNQKKTSHTFTQNNQILIDQEKMTTRKGSDFQFSIVYEAYTRAWE